jgi:DNA-binding transcriptional LysR family regulator
MGCEAELHSQARCARRRGARVGAALFIRTTRGVGLTEAGERFISRAKPALGLAQVPGPVARAPIADGRLQALLTPFAVTTPGVFLHYSGRREVLPKLRAVIEHVKYQSANVPRDRTIARRASKGHFRVSEIAISGTVDIIRSISNTS